MRTRDLKQRDNIYSKGFRAKSTAETIEFRGKYLTLNIETSRRVELIDITPEVQEEVRISGIQEGVCIISTRHTTAGS